MSERGILAARALELAPSIIREMNGRRRATSIDLTLGQPALPPEPEILERALRAMPESGYGYTETAGLVAVRDAIAKHYGFAGRDRPENVIVTVGSEQAVYLSLTCAVDPGDEVLLPEPGYPAYRGIVKMVGATPVPYLLESSTGLTPRADALAAAITPKTRAVILNDPSNPFGTITQKAEVEKIAALCQSKGITMLSDEIYRDLVYDGHAVTSVCDLSQRSIFVSGLSKSCALTGFRLGYLVAPEGFVKKATLGHQLMVTCAPRLSQLAALEIFKEPARLTAHLPFYSETRARLRAIEPELPAQAKLFLGDGAFYGIIDVSAFANGDPLALALALLDEEDVVVVPGIAFGPTGDWFWRISYAAGADLAGEGLRRIARFLEKRS